MAIRKIDWNLISEDMSTTGAKKKFEKKVDENLYKFKLKNGESTVLIRFLPQAIDDIDLPYAELKRHDVTINGKYSGEKCPQSNGGRSVPCPYCEYGTKNFYGGEKELGKKFFAQSNWYVNILVVNDLNTPENNGKIFVLKIGKSIFNKIKAKQNPSEEDKAMGIKGVNVFDYIDGINFKLKIVGKMIPDKANPGQNVEVPNYDNSSFADAPSPISLGGKALTEDEINEKIEKNLIPLKPYLVDGVKDYDKLVSSLERLVGSVSSSSKGASSSSDAAVDSKYDNSNGDFPLPSDDASDDDFLKKLRGDA